MERISGARLEIVPGIPGPAEKRLPILISEFAGERFGEPERKIPYAQGFRLVVSSKGVGLGGESDLATSYALYTLLDQLGCRWYIPSPLGEVLPKLGTIKLPVQDCPAVRVRFSAGFGIATMITLAVTDSAAWSSRQTIFSRRQCPKNYVQTTRKFARWSAVNRMIFG